MRVTTAARSLPAPRFSASPDPRPVNDLSSSPDGFVAKRDDDVSEVFDLYGSGNVKIRTGSSDPMTFKVSQACVERLFDRLEMGPAKLGNASVQCSTTGQQ